MGDQRDDEADGTSVTPEVVPNPFEALSPRQREVARLLAIGWSCREIASELGCSIKTADTHRIAVLRRLNVRNAVELAHRAILWGEVQVVQPVELLRRA